MCVAVAAHIIRGVPGYGMAMRTRAGKGVRQPRSARLRAAQQPAKLPPGIASVLSVLSSSAVVVDSEDRVLRASAAARAFGIVKGDRLMVSELAALARQVRRDRSRGKASATWSKTARKAEVFEDALARVSARLAEVAQESADALKAERLAAARRTKKAPARKAAAGKGKASAASAKEKRRTGASKRSAAQARSSNKRHQAKKASKSKE